MAQVELNPIVGDVAVTSDVTLNTKGGSVTATLRKSLAQRLGEARTRLSGAALQFSNGQAMVILAGGGEAKLKSFHVRRVSQDRFEIALEDSEAVELHTVAAAFLRLKVDQFQRDVLELSDPKSADEWRRKTTADFADVEEALADLPAPALAL